MARVQEQRSRGKARDGDETKSILYAMYGRGFTFGPRANFEQMAIAYLFAILCFFVSEFGICTAAIKLIFSLCQ